MGTTEIIVILVSLGGLLAAMGGVFALVYFIFKRPPPKAGGEAQGNTGSESR